MHTHWNWNSGVPAGDQQQQCPPQFMDNRSNNYGYPYHNSRNNYNYNYPNQMKVNYNNYFEVGPNNNYPHQNYYDPHYMTPSAAPELQNGRKWNDQNNYQQRAPRFVTNNRTNNRHHPYHNNFNSNQMRTYNNNGNYNNQRNNFGQNQNHYKPWITPELQEMIRQRNVLLKRVQLLRNPVEWEEYKTLRNKVTTMLNTAKFDYEIEMTSRPKSKRLFYCDTCDKTCFNQKALDEHNAEHIVCKLDDCTFTAHPKVVLKHIQMQHSTNLYHRIKGYKTEEEIKQWVDDRKKNFPSTVNLVRKKAERTERRARGERIPKAPKFKYPINQAKRIQNKYRQGQRGDRRGTNQMNNFMRSNSLMNGSNKNEDYIHAKNKSEIVTLENYYSLVKVGDKRKLVGKKLTFWENSAEKEIVEGQSDESCDEEEVDINTNLSITDDEEEIKPAPSSKITKTVPLVLNTLNSKIDIRALAVAEISSSSSTSSTIVMNPTTKVDTTKSNGLAGLVAYSSGSESEGEIQDSDDDEPPDEIKIEHTALTSDNGYCCNDSQSTNSTCVLKSTTPSTTKVDDMRKLNAKRKKLQEKLKILNPDNTAGNKPQPAPRQQKSIVQRLKKLAIKKKSKRLLKLKEKEDGGDEGNPESTDENEDNLTEDVSAAINGEVNSTKNEVVELAKLENKNPVASGSKSWTGNKAVKPQVKPRPRWRPPTLLERLLNEDIEREGNYLLQACRFIVENNFFENAIDQKNVPAGNNNENNLENASTSSKQT